MNDKLWNRPGSRNSEPLPPPAIDDASPPPQQEAPAGEPALLDLPARVWSRPVSAGYDSANPVAAPDRTPVFRPAPAPEPPAFEPSQPATRRQQPGPARGIASFAAVVVLSAALGAGVITGLDALRGEGGGSNGGSVVTQSEPAPVSNGVSTSMVAGGKGVADIYEAVSPAVVEISVIGRGGAGIGSGVVIRGDGLILTNNHVIAGATTIDVTFSDGRSAAATIVETKPSDDLAVIKVDGMSGLTAAKIGDSATLRAGDEIIAIGNPLGLENTVTTGVVSGLNRTLRGGRGEATLTNLIQIDAAVNSGNSGGGLFNMNGELVGVPSAIENPSGDAVFAGVAYAIPIQTALSDLATLRSL